jgi:hypothetical protein
VSGLVRLVRIVRRIRAGALATDSIAFHLSFLSFSPRTERNIHLQPEASVLSLSDP